MKTPETRVGWSYSPVPDGFVPRGKRESGFMVKSFVKHIGTESPLPEKCLPTSTPALRKQPLESCSSFLDTTCLVLRHRCWIEMNMKTLSRYSLALLMGVSQCAFTQTASGPSSGQKKPNVIFFLVDDLGWADVGYEGSSLYATPNIDMFAKRGVRFTQAYSACPVRSPTVCASTWPRASTKT